MGAQWTECAMLVTDCLGPSLDALVRNCRDRRLAPESILRVAKQLIDRAEIVHGRGFIHRDIKPYVALS